MVEGRGGVIRAEVVRYLKGIDFPADKNRMLNQAKTNSAPDNVMSWISQLPERQYRDSDDVGQAVGTL